jgi:hypothetical protein
MEGTAGAAVEAKRGDNCGPLTLTLFPLRGARGPEVRTWR